MVGEDTHFQCNVNYTGTWSELRIGTTGDTCSPVDTIQIFSNGTVLNLEQGIWDGILSSNDAFITAKRYTEDVQFCAWYTEVLQGHIHSM